MNRNVFPFPSAERALVVGRVRGEGIEALRVRDTASEQARIIAAATLPWDSGVTLGGPLERLLGWRPEEPVILAVDTPDFAGGSVTLRWPSAAVTHARTSLQELSLRAVWQARELVRDRSAKILQCVLEDLELLSEDRGEWQENVKEEALEITTTILFCLGPPLASTSVSPPPDVPQCHFVILPVLFGELLTAGDAPQGLLIVEEDHLSFITRRESVLTYASSVPLGTTVIREHLERQLSCSPREAALLLERMNQGDLSPESARVVARLLRDLLPLFRSAVSLFTEYPPPPGELTNVWVTGLFAALMQRFFFGSHTLFPRGQARPVVSQVLPPLDTTRTYGQSLALGRTEVQLLEHLAVSIFRRQRTAVASAVSPGNG
jgi:hypothetical protein